MEFGALLMFRNPPPWRRPIQEVYRDLLDLCVLAEERGFDHLWTSEHHFLDDGWSPSQLPILAAIAARTKRIRIGTFVLLLPFHNPLRVAEDAATVDILSNGRFDLAVGPGSDPADYATFGVPMKQRRSRMHEGLQIIRRCLNQEEFSFSGKYWEFSNVRMTPKPVQQPLPLWAAAMGPKAVEEAGANGYHLAAAPPAALQKIYDDALRKAGHNPAKFQRAGLHVGHLAETHDKAWDQCEAHVHWHTQVHYSRIMAAPENQGLVRAIAPNRDLTVPPVGELRKQGRGPYGPTYVGTPDEVIKMLEEELKVCPMTQMIFIIDPPGMDPRHIRSSLELYATEVIPHFRHR
jgi:alkanesulfonate monooxygenase SsuD/methylene tetrahydromethanopterin reductase-like flavin-dependent oxidoreductase (luciferase family)